jgi:DtxR family Mn-dependent transcriptional regulator
MSCCDVERSEAMEKYLRAIYLLSFRAPPVSTSQLAARLGVAPPSVSAMLRRLADVGLLAASGSTGIVLTEHGDRHAMNVIRRHRLIETFLVVEAAAAPLQHAASELLIDRIDSVLGHPQRDPHGDPIPPSSGDHVEDWSPALAEAPDGANFQVNRVSDEESAALRYLAGLGIEPGVTLRVLEREPFGGPLWVEIGSRHRALGTQLTNLVHGVVLP